MLIDKSILTPTDVASKLGYSTNTIYKYIAAGWLKAYRDPGHRSLKILESDIDDFLEVWKSKKERIQPLHDK